jgi:hypothetical protein
MLPRPVVVAFLLFEIMNLGCGGGPVVLSPDEKMTLYSLDPSSMEGSMRWDGKKHSGETFHGYVVFGKLEIVDAAKRKEIAHAMNTGVAKGDAMAKCFEPRHGIRATKGDVVRDFVVCFECAQFVVHQGETSERKAISRDPQPVLNNLLKKAGVNVAPELYEKAE